MHIEIENQSPSQRNKNGMNRAYVPAKGVETSNTQHETWKKYEWKKNKEKEMT